MRKEAYVASDGRLGAKEAAEKVYLTEKGDPG
jgi:hypothetical protein